MTKLSLKSIDEMKYIYPKVYQYNDTDTKP